MCVCTHTHIHPAHTIILLSLSGSLSHNQLVLSRGIHPTQLPPFILLSQLLSLPLSAPSFPLLLRHLLLLPLPASASFSLSFPSCSYVPARRRGLRVRIHVGWLRAQVQAANRTSFFPQETEHCAGTLEGAGAPSWTSNPGAFFPNWAVFFIYSIYPLSLEDSFTWLWTIWIFVFAHSFCTLSFEQLPPEWWSMYCLHPAPYQTSAQWG